MREVPGDGVVGAGGLAHDGDAVADLAEVGGDGGVVVGGGDPAHVGLNVAVDTVVEEHAVVGVAVPSLLTVVDGGSIVHGLVPLNGFDEVLGLSQSDSSNDNVCVLGLLVEQSKKEREAEILQNRLAILNWQNTAKEMDRTHAKDMANLINAVPDDILKNLPRSDSYRQRTDHLTLECEQLEQANFLLYGIRPIYSIDVPVNISQGNYVNLQH